MCILSIFDILFCIFHILWKFHRNMTKKTLNWTQKTSCRKWSYISNKTPLSQSCFKHKIQLKDDFMSAKKWYPNNHQNFIGSIENHSAQSNILSTGKRHHIFHEYKYSLVNIIKYRKSLLILSNMTFSYSK